MRQSNKNNSRQLWLILKTAIALLAVWFIYMRVIEKENAGDWWNDARIAISNRPFTCYLILFLMLVNWSVEAGKWKMMISKVEKISFLNSLEAVFSGLTVSFFTPNRVGEYAGRIFHLETADRVEATLITVIENYSQLLVTLIAGSVSLIVYTHDIVNIPFYLWSGLSIMTLSISAASLVLFFNVSVVDALVRRFRVPLSWNHYLAVFSFYKFRDLASLLFLAILRYMIFSFQFYLLLGVFGLEIPYTTALMLISLTFFLMTIVPTMAFTEIGVRGAVATYFFSHFSPDPLPVVQAAFSLWIINLVIPALCGALFVFRFKFIRRKSTS